MPQRHPHPQLLPPNTVEHWYRGGPRLAAWRGLGEIGEHSPEEWIGSATHRFGDPEHGLSRLADGALLRDAVRSDPVGWLGRDDGESGDVGVLVKILDAAQRLPVHVHPTREFARTHLACPYGKTEAWYILEASTGASVWLGWQEEVSSERLADLVERQDAVQMLSLMNEVTVSPGDGILVPAGVPHAIGEGILLIEAQEPTDQSILLEHTNTTAAAAEIFLGLSRDVALSATTRAAGGVGRLVVRAADRGSQAVAPALPLAATPFFQMDVLLGPQAAQLPAGFAIVLGLSGAGAFSGGGGQVDRYPLRQGEAWVVPASIGRWTVSGDVTALVCRPGTSWPPSA